MRRSAILATFLLTSLLAGCATTPSPVGDAEAAHSGAACPSGAFVNGFLSTGSPNCAAPPAPSFAAVKCDAGEVVTGIGSDGKPVCEDVMTVAQASMESQPPPPPSRPAKSLAMTSNGAISGNTKSYTIASASPGIKWSDLTLALDGVPLAYDGDAPADADNEYYVSDGPHAAPGRVAPSTSIDAGDRLTLHHGSLSGKTLRVIDAEANAVILTLVVG